jgi:hypothetical protein
MSTLNLEPVQAQCRNGPRLRNALAYADGFKAVIGMLDTFVSNEDESVALSVSTPNPDQALEHLARAALGAMKPYSFCDS